jgi:short-subunit dehydrogenase
MATSGKDFPRPSEIMTYHTKTYDRIDPTSSGFDGKGKTVFITGGSDGIGYAISESFAKAGAAKIVIVARRWEPLEGAKKRLTTAYPKVQVDVVSLSVEDFDAVEKAMKDAGPIDVLVLNVAYIHKQGAPTSTIPTSEITKTFNINVVANFHLMNTYINTLPKPSSGDKTVLVVSSGAAHLDMPYIAGYGASKAALARMTSLLALEHTPEKDHVRLVTFHPGIIYTPAAQKEYPEDALVWEDVQLPGDFAVWLAGKESEFLHGRFLWAQW